MIYVRQPLDHTHKKEEPLAAAPLLFFHSASVSSFISTTGAASRFLA